MGSGDLGKSDVKCIFTCFRPKSHSLAAMETLVSEFLLGFPGTDALVMKDLFRFRLGPNVIVLDYQSVNETSHFFSIKAVIHCWINPRFSLIISRCCH